MHTNKIKTDLKFNVAQLLREEVGAQRSYSFTEPKIQLDEELVLQQIAGKTKFTRTISGVLVDASVTGSVEMDCMRCLKPSTQQISMHIWDEFHSQIEVSTGTPLPNPDEEDPFFIDELHMLDLEEAIREYGLLELPMRPLCTEACKGLCPHCGADRNTESCSCEEIQGDERFAALRSLLPD